MQQFIKDTCKEVWQRQIKVILYDGTLSESTQTATENDIGDYEVCSNIERTAEWVHSSKH